MREGFEIRLKKAMAIRGYKQVDLVEKTKLRKSAISQYFSGKYEPKQKALVVIAKALNVTEHWLMGYDVPMEKPTNHSMPESKYFPKLGRIAGGVPMFTINEHEEYIVASTDIKADFCLEVRGDSMINARINDGDIVFIRKQADVNDGEIAAVQIDDEATLKRVYKSNDELRLEAANDRYPTLIYKITDAQNVSILGKAVAFLSNI